MRQSFSIISKSLFGLAKSSKSLRNPLAFRFSKGQNTLDRSMERLGKSLQHEFEHEEEEFNAEETELNETISNFIKENNWTFKIEQGITRITMEKVVGDTTVSVYSQVKAVENEEDQSQEKEEGEEEEDENDMGGNDKYNDFFVVVQRSGKTRCLFFDMISFEGELEINSFFPSENSEKAVSNRLSYTQSETYTGPMFDTLDEKVQTSTINYLKSLGVDSTLASFLESATRDLEQRYYMDWLNETSSFFK